MSLERRLVKAMRSTEPSFRGDIADTSIVSMSPPTIPPVSAVRSSEHDAASCVHTVAQNGLCRLPLLSVIIPCRNESRHIRICLRTIENQDLPRECFEVIVVDGMSDDNTREIVSELTKTASNLKIVENYSRTTPCAMNRGLLASRGKYVAILGAHAEYAEDYLSTCLDLLNEHPEACCVGGPIESKGVGDFGRAVAVVMAHPLGIGNAKHRDPTYEGYAEGACYPVFRKDIFRKVGLYDEQLDRNQDDEMNYRLALHGEKVFISPRARCTYYVRETPLQLFRQYFQYGYWRVAVLRKHGRPASFRQITPPLFMSAMLAVALVGLLLPDSWKFSAWLLPAIYGTALIVVAAAKAPHLGWRAGWLVPVAAAIMHIGYATGFVKASLKDCNARIHNGKFKKGEHHAT